jgi:hypothetical protein
MEASHMHDKFDRLAHGLHRMPSIESTILSATATSSAGNSPRAAPP